MRRPLTIGVPDVVEPVNRRLLTDAVRSLQLDSAVFVSTARRGCARLRNAKASRARLDAVFAEEDASCDA